MKILIKKITEDIKNTVKNKRVILGVSGGIDSLVLAILINQTIGNNLYCLFVDSGFNRPKETKQINKFLKDYDIKLETAEVKKIFLQSLKNKKYSRDKKKIIKNNFVKIFNSHALKKKADFIAHATNKNDSELLFERDKNLIKNTKIKNLEPLIDINKNQIKDIAKYLKLPDEILNKYPLSSWGLARRIIGEVTKKKLNYILKADSIFINCLKKEKIYGGFKNAAVYLYPHLDQKDKKRKYFIILKIIDKKGETIVLPSNFVKNISLKITKEVPSVSRVVYDVSINKIIEREWE